MECIGKFKYKGIEKKDGGKFVNDRGQEIEYKPSYHLKLDEMVDGVAYERKFKLPLDSEVVPQLINKPLYYDITLKFDVAFFGSSSRVVPVALVNSNDK